MVSMKDIAKKCGVSVATVSKALNGQKDIGEETRKKICAAAEEMGYMASSVARALKTNRSFNLGMLLVDERRSGLGHEYFSTIIEGFKAEAESHGYDVTFINSHVGNQPTSYVKHCRYRALDGVLVACVNFEDPRIQELAAGNITADPYWRGPEKNACRFCDYAAACHFEEGRGGDCRRWLPSVTTKEFWERVEGREE